MNGVQVPAGFCGILRDECQRLVSEAAADGREAALCYGTGFTSEGDVGHPWALMLSGSGWSFGDGCSPSVDAPTQRGFIRAIVEGASVSFEPAEVTALARFLEMRASPDVQDRAGAYTSLPDALRELVSRDDYLACTASAPFESIVGVSRVARDSQDLWTEVTVALAVFDRRAQTVELLPAVTYLVRPIDTRFEWGDAGLSCMPSQF
ncbi:MAG: hypothetical protein Kow0010_06990 [Dehalococcoidia bacterium]